jgi:hypothetical protein
MLHPTFTWACNLDRTLALTNRTAANEVGKRVERTDVEDRPAGPVLILPALHFVACLLIEFGISDGAGWKWYPLFYFDLGASSFLCKRPR